MTHPSKFHAHFWTGMGERFGKRWFDLTGPLPTKVWKELLDEFSREEIDAAQLRLKDRPERERADPPTYTEFQALLATAAQSRSVDPGAQMRSYWRSVVVAECMRAAGLLNIVPYGELRLEQMPADVYRPVSAKCSALVEDACRRQQAGNDPAPVCSYVNAELWNFLKQWRRQGEHYIGHLSADDRSEAVAR